MCRVRVETREEKGSNYSKLAGRATCRRMAEKQ